MGGGMRQVPKEQIWDSRSKSKAVPLKFQVAPKLGCRAREGWRPFRANRDEQRKLMGKSSAAWKHRVCFLVIPRQISAAPALP
jgi:hypothetical protein